MRDFEAELERRLLLAGRSLTRETAQPHWNHGGLRRLAITLLVVVAGVLGGLAMSGAFAGRSATAWDAQLVRFANASPLVLLERAGWRVNYANEDSTQTGELRFTTGSVPSSPSAEDFTTDAQLNWRTGKLSQWMADRANSADLTTTAPVLGTAAHVYQYSGGRPGHQDITALWEYDGRVLEFRAGAANVAAFESLLASLRAVDTDTWLSALPASVVQTEDRSAVITRMLRGVTLPPGFNASAITGANLTSDRYQLGATVTGTVACSWFKRWAQARRTGNSAGIQQAVRAMAIAKKWPILQQMSKSGAYPEILELLAAAMSNGNWHGRPLIGAVNSGLGCPALGVPLTGPGANSGGPVPLTNLPPSNARSR